MNKVIKIEDYPCGSGKTTRMIENFKEDQKYLVILPMLTEVTKVIEGSKDIEFVQPHANKNVTIFFRWKCICNNSPEPLFGFVIFHIHF